MNAVNIRSQLTEVCTALRIKLQSTSEWREDDIKTYACVCLSLSLYSSTCVCPSSSTECAPVDTLTLKRALVAGCFLNVARQLPAPTKTATPKYSTVIGHQEVRRVRVSVLLRVRLCVCLCLCACVW